MAMSVFVHYFFKCNQQKIIFLFLNKIEIRQSCHFTSKNFRKETNWQEKVYIYFGETSQMQYINVGILIALCDVTIFGTTLFSHNVAMAIFLKTCTTWFICSNFLTDSWSRWDREGLSVEQCHCDIIYLIILWNHCNFNV